jgi:hypothetical protein
VVLKIGTDARQVVDHRNIERCQRVRIATARLHEDFGRVDGAKR